MPTIDLSQLPSPTIIEALDFETILSEVKAVMVAGFPAGQQAAGPTTNPKQRPPRTACQQGRPPPSKP